MKTILAPLCAMALFWPMTTAMAEIKPVLDKCTLSAGKVSLKPIAIESTWRKKYWIEGCCYTVDKEEVTHIRLVKRAWVPLWRAKSPDGLRLAWRAAHADTAFFTGFKPAQYGGEEAEFPPRLRRLDLRRGVWLEDLRLSYAGTNGLCPIQIIDIQAEDDDVVVLCSLSQLSKEHPQGWDVQGYWVACYCRSNPQPVWARTLPVEGQQHPEGARLLSFNPPGFTQSVLRHLSFMDDRLVVCAEPVQPVFCLSRETGNEVWKLPRPWEYQRGYIGPSVWSHFISRFRDNDRFAVAEEDQQAARQRFDQQHECSLVGGPVVLPLPFKRDFDTHSIFLLVARGPTNDLSRFVSDCVVYEFNDQGRPVSLAQLPEMMEGGDFCRQEEGVVWRGQMDTFVLIAPAVRAPGGMLGGGGVDGLSRVMWYRRLPPPKSAAWLRTGKEINWATFGGTHAFSLPAQVFGFPAGGYVIREKDQVMHFPLVALDLAEGQATDLVLKVPFTGSLDINPTNFFKQYGTDGSTNYWYGGGHLLTITVLEANGNNLEITLGTKQWAGAVTFAANELPLAFPHHQQGQKANALAAARKQVKALDRGKLDDALLRHLRPHEDHDFFLVKALLEAGANPNVKSPAGYTPLLVAASEDRAEIVEALLSAGAAANARSLNNYEEIALIVAAGSSVEAAKKVALLLQAGANVHDTTRGGRTALHAAAMRGNFLAVEILLKHGARCSQADTDHTTALMLAALTGQANVVRLLLAAGAGLEDRDHQGMTPLMHAVNTPDPEEVTRVLLAAGADRNARNAAGQTAFDLARTRGYGGPALIKLLETYGQPPAGLRPSP